ncbi:MAG: TlpA family protein disulfide reductase [Proteobacteria bacterium]|nr:TlpA family protein disulfide reductase [Pseudomonadota bacterium]MCP4917487.1 TlpA family protein disulfide reductase [Pseudomonadota bacterium]
MSEPASGPRLWILGLGLVLLIPMVWVLASGFGKDPHAVPDAMTGEVAPPFSLHTMDGELVTLKELEGRPVVLNFWSTWCVPCKIEHPVLQNGASTYGPRGVVFLGVLYGDTEAAARPFLKKNGSTYPTLLDPDGATAVDYGVAGVPETFFIDGDGMIVRKVAGPVSADVLITTLEGML